jgi:hypothetical protein
MNEDTVVNNNKVSEQTHVYFQPSAPPMAHSMFGPLPTPMNIPSKFLDSSQPSIMAEAVANMIVILDGLANDHKVSTVQQRQTKKAKKALFDILNPPDIEDNKNYHVFLFRVLPLVVLVIIMIGVKVYMSITGS